MYVIEVPEVFKKANGKPFRHLKLDAEGLGVKVVDEEGNPVIRQGPAGPAYEFETEVAGYLDKLGFALDRIMNLANDKEARAERAKEKPSRELPMMGMEDSSVIVDIWSAIHVAQNGKGRNLELERHSHAWLLKNLENYGVDLYGSDAAVIFGPVKKAEEVEPNRAEKRREKQT